MESLRKRDSAVEKEIARFLDDYFYPSIGANVVRHTDKEMQLKGVDIILTYKNLQSVLVDEKAMSQYINRDLPTFAFELSFINQGRLVEGWLLDRSKKTQYYLLVWVWASRTWNIKEDDISRISASLISREKILKFLEDRNYKQQRLIEIADKIRNSGRYGPINKENGEKFYFFNSGQLAEKPINIVIRRDVLSTLAYENFTFER